MERRGLCLPLRSTACCNTLAVPHALAILQIVYRDYVDISVAVSSPRGLVVPVIRNAESLTLVGLEKAMADLAKRARADSIALEEMAGGTFTVSNGGVFGSMMGTPIINPPQSAILGMHGIKQRPVAVNVSAVERLLCSRAMSRRAAAESHVSPAHS